MTSLIFIVSCVATDFFGSMSSIYGKTTFLLFSYVALRGCAERTAPGAALVIKPVLHCSSWS